MSLQDDPIRFIFNLLRKRDMIVKGFTTPVLFIIFNRPKTTRLVFEVIRRVRPLRLFIAADGPRPHVDSDPELCEQVRHIKNLVDWDCEVNTLYRDENMGSDKGVFLALNWFFQNVQEGIVLEDDCLPSERFFWFCQELLERYRDDQRVMQICGNNPFGEWGRENYSYYFSRHGLINGWASWQRAWQLNCFDKAQYKNIREQGFFEEYFPSRLEKLLWFRRFDSVASNAGQRQWWRYRWDYSRFIQSGLSIIPRTTLVSSLDTNSGRYPIGSEKSSLDEALLHPPFVIRDMEADKLYFSSGADKERKSSRSLLVRQTMLVR